MAVRKREFHSHEDGSHHEKFIYLCRDTESGKVYVEYERIDPRGNQSVRKFEIEEFLSSENSSATSKLRTLIGTLVTDGGDA